MPTQKVKTPSVKKVKQLKTYQTTEELVKDIMYLFLMGVRRDAYDQNKFHAIDYRYDAGQDATQDLDTFIDNVVSELNDLEVRYNEVMNIDDEDERYETLHDEVKCKIYDILPNLSNMHSDDAYDFIQLIYHYWEN